MTEREKLARELFDIHAGDFDIKQEAKDRAFESAKYWWLPVADHVIKREIEARKDEVGQIPASYSNDEYHRKRIAELERQLKEVANGKKVQHD